MSTLHEGPYTFIIIPYRIILWFTNVSDKNFRENHNTQKKCDLHAG